MDREKAISILNSHKRYIIKNVYDKKPEIATAIFTLYPNFEYPDFSHKRISEFLTLINKK